MFEPLGNFIFKATDKYKLSTQAKAALICEKARNVILQDFKKYKNTWKPLKYSKNILTIACTSSGASSNLYMQTHIFIEKINLQNIPEKVYEIKIVRN